MHLIDDAAPAIVDVLANDKSEPAARDGRDAGAEHPSGARPTRAHHSRRSSRSPSVGPAPVSPGGAGPSGVRPAATEAAAETDPQLERILRQIADQLHSAAEAHERAHHQRHGSAHGRMIGAVSEVFAEGREALSEGYDQVLDLWNHVRGNGASAGAPAAAPPVDARVEMPSLTIWEEPLGFLSRARVSLGRGEREEAMHELAALRDSATRAHLRFRQYMDRVADGAGAAATSLQGVVALSTMALSILSGAAVVGAGAVAVGAMSGAGAMLGTLATGGAQRASEMRHGLRREADLLGLIESAGIEGLTTMVSALLGGEVSRRMFAALGRRMAATITAEQLAHLQLGREVPLEVLGSTLATRLQHVAVSAVSAVLQAPLSVALRTVLNDPQRPRSIGAFVDRVVHEMVAGGVLAIVMTLLLGHGRAAPRVVEPSARAPSPQPSTPAAHAAPAPVAPAAPATAPRLAGERTALVPPANAPRLAGERTALVPPAPSAPRPVAHVMEMPAVPARAQAGDPVPSSWMAGPVRAGGPRQPNPVMEMPVALPPPRQTMHGLAPPPEVAHEPTLLQPGTEPTLVQPGTEPTLLQPGTEPTLVQPGTEPTLLQPGTEPTLVQPGTEPTLVQPGNESSPLRALPHLLRAKEVGYLLQAYRALRSVDPEAAEQLLRGHGFNSIIELIEFEQAAHQRARRLGIS